MRSLIGTAIVAALALGGSAADAAEIVIKFSHVVAENTPKGQAALRFKQIVEHRLAGRVKVEVFPNAMLMDDEAAIDGLRNDTIQAAAPSLSLLEPYSKAYQVFDLPFLFKSPEAVDRFQKGPAGQQLLGAMHGIGIEGLCFVHSGMKQLSANVPLRVPEDVKGKKFRIQPSSVIEAQFQALGAIPVRAPFTKVFHLLQTGTVDGQENTWTNIYSQRFYEAQPYITETNHGSLEYMFVVARNFWERLPEDTRTDMAKAANEACDYGNTVAADLNIRDKQKIIESRYSQIIELTPQQRDRWAEAMKPVWTQFQPVIGKEIIEAAAAANGGS
jgi:C4-dicarboxylate-binding protein DctP